MKLKLHHINFATKNVPEMNRFYRDVIGLGDEDPRQLPDLNKNTGVVGEVAFVTDGDIQLHLAEQDLNMGFKTGQIVNPLDRGHIAYRTDDLAAFKAHLEANNVPYSDWADVAVAGWKQIFFYDPDGNIIEVHEAAKETSGN